MTPVPHGVFKQGLQEQLRDFSFCRFRLDVVVQSQSLAQPELLNAHVKIRELELFRQAPNRSIAVFECQAKKIAQPDDHAAGSAGLVADQACDGMKRVKEKMRMQLHTERI